MKLAAFWDRISNELVDALAGHRASIPTLRVEEKADRSLLTDADLAMETLIVERIHGLDPHARVIAEESAASLAPDPDFTTQGRIWVIDPIDGTAEFLRPHSSEFCSVVCLLEDGRPVGALVVAPELGVGRTPVVIAACDGRVTVNGRPATANSGRPPTYSVSVTRSSRRPPPAHEAVMERAGYTMKTRATSQTLDMARTALDLTAVTREPVRFDLFYRRRQKAWDALAGLCLGEFTGLLSSNMAGRSPSPVGLDILAQGEPVFPATVMGREETVGWFLGAESHPGACCS
ncbi:inositol monophosphatase family protein [Longispora sp. K20-0274]|uniref:inositol monophosphatase family protein n=1 Tax=Longispora sp. K20-0274 TaxID=3088255 RepID=UPI00399AC5D9